MLATPHLLAEFNAWANARLHGAAASLPAAEVSRDRGAFFGSILGTLNQQNTPFGSIPKLLSLAPSTSGFSLRPSSV